LNGDWHSIIIWGILHSYEKQGTHKQPFNRYHTMMLPVDVHSLTPPFSHTSLEKESMFSTAPAVIIEDKRHQPHGNRITRTQRKDTAEMLVSVDTSVGNGKDDVLQHEWCSSYRPIAPKEAKMPPSLRQATSLGVVVSTLLDFEEELVNNNNNSNKEETQDKENFGRGFVPGSFDVICGRRGSTVWHHLGNRYFRYLAEQATRTYVSVGNRKLRTPIISEIIAEVHLKGNGFLKQERSSSNGDHEEEEWTQEVANLLIREKVGQMLYNALAHKYRSSHKAKQQHGTRFAL
jgi:hypothetical protein